jgi:hypothetical protein
MRKDQIHSFTNTGLPIAHPVRYALKINYPKKKSLK